MNKKNRHTRVVPCADPVYPEWEDLAVGMCRDCGGRDFCRHGRRQSVCKECGGVYSLRSPQEEMAGTAFGLRCCVLARTGDISADNAAEARYPRMIGASLHARTAGVQASASTGGSGGCVRRAEAVRSVRKEGERVSARTAVEIRYADTRD
jgi:hypothetical protein